MINYLMKINVNNNKIIRILQAEEAKLETLGWIKKHIVRYDANRNTQKQIKTGAGLAAEAFTHL